MKITIDRAVIEQALTQMLKSHTCPLLPDDLDASITALRTALEQPEQEPVAWVLNRELFWPFEYEILSKDGDNAIPLYTTPPQRKPLSDKEILAYRYMIDWTAEWSYINFARAIEAAHGIKEPT